MLSTLLDTQETKVGAVGGTDKILAQVKLKS